MWNLKQGPKLVTIQKYKDCLNGSAKLSSRGRSKFEFVFLMPFLYGFRASQSERKERRYTRTGSVGFGFGLFISYLSTGD